MQYKRIDFNWQEGRVTYLWPDYPLVIAGQQPLRVLIEQLDAGDDIDGIISNLAQMFQADVEEVRSYVLGIVQTLDSLETLKPSDEGLDVNNSLAMATLNVTRSCNLRCVHCYAGDSTVRKSEELTIEQIRSIVTALSNRITRAPKLLIISGGEPTLVPDKLRMAVLTARECGLTPRLNTNGYKLDDELADFLAKNEVLVQVSIDGSTQESHNLLRGTGDSFAVALTAVKRLVDKGCRIRISCTTHKGNVEQIPDMIDMVRQLGAEQFITSNLVKIGRAFKNDLQPVSFEEEFVILYNTVKDNREKQKMTRSTLLAETVSAIRAGIKFTYCGTGCCTCCVDFNGQIYPCINMMRSDYCAGDLRTTDLTTAWTSSSVLQQLRTLSVDTMNRACSKCIFRYFCGGYCRGETIEATGKLTALYARCKAWKQAITRILVFLSETPDLYDFQEPYVGGLHHE